MKTAFAAIGRFIYDTWYGTMVVCLAVTSCLLGLLWANGVFCDVLQERGRTTLLLVEMVVVVNSGVAVVLSLWRRRWKRAIVQSFACYLSVCGFCIVFLFAHALHLEVPASPSERWIERYVCGDTSIARGNLRFLGRVGYACAVFEVTGAGVEGVIGRAKPAPDRKVADFIGVFESLEPRIVLPDDAKIYVFDSRGNTLTFVTASDGKCYLVIRTPYPGFT